MRNGSRNSPPVADNITRMFYEPHIDYYELACPRLPEAYDGLTILHLSDLHITRWTQRLTLWEAALGHLQPDLLAVTGDLGHRSWHWKTALEPISRLLHAVRPAMGTYFILGNHDALKLAPALANVNGFRYLANETLFLPPPHAAATSQPHRQHQLQGVDPTHGGSTGLAPAAASPRFALIGLHQHRRIDTDIPCAMREVAPDDFKLMLMHYPDLIHQAAAAGVDVCLAGHTHGGQICWPDGQPIIRHDALPRLMCTGVHQIDQTWMVVNRGIGVAGVRVRLFCPPQAIFLTLRRGEAEARA